MIESKEWERRFKARIVEICTQNGWTKAAATKAARAEYDGAEGTYLRDGYEDDPEGSADESMSYWDDDA